MILDHSRTGAPLLRGTVFVTLAFAALLAVRVPSLAQPAGADQGLYAYVGQRILAGEQPYRDAWDQKPPGIHFLYAALWFVWPHESAVPGADLAASALTAGLLLGIGRILGGRGAGAASALLYLLLANPSFTRLGGVRIRSQAETFIAVFITAAMLYSAERWRRDGMSASHGRAWGMFRSAASASIIAGALVGVAAVFKYTAIAYALPVAALLALPRRDTPGVSRLPWHTLGGAVVGRGLLVALGIALPLAAMVAHFWYHGALEDLRLATLTYNMAYSGETYGSVWHAVAYLATFPIGQARLDPLWFLGGAGCLLLLVKGRREPHLWVAPLWVAAASVAIAVNGSRGLPQYFVQAAPALALAAGLAATLAWKNLGMRARAVVFLVMAAGAWRVGDVPRGIDYTRYDFLGLTGRLDRDTYLARYGGADTGAKYSALAVHRLADYVEAHTAAADRIYVFGFSPWAYVGSGRASASRWFWSRPVIVGFEQARPGYGWRGVLSDLQRTGPALVVLQRRDWDPVETNSDVYFMGRPELAGWLTGQYTQTAEMHNFVIWTRRR